VCFVPRGLFLLWHEEEQVSDKLFHSYELQLDLLRSRGLGIVDPEEGKVNETRQAMQTTTGD